MQGKYEHYFLGANSSHGFFSLYDDFAKERSGDMLRIIKGGPGCGKSTFMRKIAAYAETLGSSVEYIHCSGDADSLDGIYIKEARLAYVDGTSPHVIEPALPGAAGSYLDLGFVIRESVRTERDAIADLFDAYRGEYQKAYSLLRAYSILTEKKPQNTDLICSDAAAFAEMNLSELPYFREKKRFLSSFGGDGGKTLWETADNVGALTVLRGSAEENDVYLRSVYAARVRHGGAVICCFDPLCPNLLQALLFPEEKIVLFSSTEVFPAPDGSSAQKAAVSEEALARQSILSLAQSFLRKAKERHDELEALYRPHLDFSGVDSLLAAEEERLRRLLASEQNELKGVQKL